MAVSKTCPMCDSETTCGQYHLYVIELSKDVLQEARFKRANPNASPNAKCFYVGETSHTPECRFQQHKLYFEGETHFLCTCKGTPREYPFRGRAEGGRTKGNRYVGKYGLYLRSRMFKKQNPVGTTRAESKKAESALAEALRSRGNAVWSH